MNSQKNLLELLKNGKNLTFIGAHNPFIAKVAEREDFEGVYLSGAGLSNSMGVSDTGILELNDFTYAGKNISKAISLPLLGDADTGFGDIATTVKAYINAGFSGLHIEDQIFPKRCGHLDGKEVVLIKEMEDKIRTAVDIRNTLDKNFVIIARTDARGASNINKDDQFKESLLRGIAYKKAGADVIFPESLRSKKEFLDYRSGINGHLLANMTEFGKTPFITNEEFFKMGYQIVIFPVTINTSRPSGKSTFSHQEDGNQRNIVSQMMTREKVGVILGKVKS